MASSWDIYYARLGGKQTYFTPAPWASLVWSVTFLQLENNNTTYLDISIGLLYML